VSDFSDGIELRSVSKEFTTRAGAVLALDDVDLSTPRGSFVSLIGPSGCGKSTILRMLADLESVTRGDVRVHGAPPAEVRKAHRLGIAFQDSALLPWKSVRDNVRLPLEAAGLSDDGTVAERLNFELLRVWGELRTTTLMVTHSVIEATLLSDTVVVMSPRPGRITEVVPIDLPRPRTRELLSTPEFLEYTALLTRLLFGDEQERAA
jgi:NitT/TauT family transport system ATP-binding protein